MDREITEHFEGRDEWQRLKESPVIFIGGDLSVAIDIDPKGVGWVLTREPRTIRYRVAERKVA